MKTFVLAFLIAVLFTPLAVAGIVNNSGSLAEDSISVAFQLLDSIGNPVKAVSGDSGWMFVFYPSGALAAKDSCRLTSDAKIVTRNLTTLGKAMGFYCYQNSVTNLIGTAKNGTYKYTWIAWDSSINLGTTVNGEFQVLTAGDYSAEIDSLIKETTLHRTLDVSSTGEAGIDWANVGSPSTAVNLSATEIRRADTAFTIPAAQRGLIADSVWNKGFAAGFAAGSMGDSLNNSSFVGALDFAHVLNPTTAVNLSALEIRRADSAMNVANIASTDTITTVLGNVNGSVGSVAGGGITAGSFTAGAIDANAIATDAIGAAEIAANAIGSSEIGSGAIDATAMANNSINANTFLAGAIDLFAIANNVYTAIADTVWGHDTNNTFWNGLPAKFGYWNAKQQIGGAGGGAGNDSLQVRRWVWDSTSWRYHEPGGARYKRTVDTLLETLAECGGGTGAFPCTLFVFQSPGGVTALQGVFLRVFNSTQTATAATGTTDANGRSIFSLDAAAYKVYGYQGGYAFNPQPLSVTVTTSGANDTLLATPYNPGAPATPDLCRVYGWVSDLSGDQIAQASVHARISESPLRFQNLIISPYERVTSTDTTGYWYLDLFPSPVLNPSTTRYEFEIRFTSGAILRRKVAVPDSAQWFLTW